MGVVILFSNYIITIYLYNNITLVVAIIMADPI